MMHIYPPSGTTNAVQGAKAAIAETSDAPSSAYPADVEARLREDCAAVIARYPQPRSALLPMLHLIQSVDSFVSPRGVALCAELLDLSRSEVSAVATFYTQYKRKPNGRYTVGVCTNTLCAIMGGDQIFEAVSEHLGVGHEETTADGAITLEGVECNAACDYAPVVMVNWEFFDNVTPERAIELVDRLRNGETVVADRGPAVQDFRAVSRVLAGFEDGLADEGPAGGEPTLVGLRISREHDWQAPRYPADSPGAQVQDQVHQQVRKDGDVTVSEEATAQVGLDEVDLGERTQEVPVPQAEAGEQGEAAQVPEGAAAAADAEPPVGEEGSSAQHAKPVGETERTGQDERGRTEGSES